MTRNSPSTDARLRQFMQAQIPGLVRILPHALASRAKLRDLVGLVVGEHTVDGVQRGLMVSIVPRAELSLYITRDDARTIPAGRDDALPIFVKDRGARHAFLLPITDDLRCSLGRLTPNGAVS